LQQLAKSALRSKEADERVVRIDSACIELLDPRAIHVHGSPIRLTAASSLVFVLRREPYASLFPALLGPAKQC
jgi:hypothetical protein